MHRTVERIAAAFAEAVAAEEYERAEGWLAIARWRVGQIDLVFEDPARRPAR